VERNRWRGSGKVNKRFEARWLLEEDCDAIVTNVWNLAKQRGHTQVNDLIMSVSKELHTWSKDILGDLQKRIDKLKEELEAYRKSDISEHKVRKEQVARLKLHRLEEQWDLYSRQRAHVQWLEKGDRNTSYFHLCASERNKANTIHKLKGESGGERG
jgi:gas vesicle protein